jgi:glutamine phosphoribosylpyrophosphate amidotransferase
MKTTMASCRGAYACVAMLAGFGLIAFRDPNGIRPLGIATRQGQRGGTDYWLLVKALLLKDWDSPTGKMSRMVSPS